MAMFYSASTGGFYLTAVHGNTMPADVVEISAEEHQALLEGQAAGGSIAPGEDGRPTLEFAPPEELLARAQQAAVLRMKDWLDAFLRPFTTGLPMEEVSSWTRKSEAARAHLAGATPHPMLLAEAEITGETTELLASKIAALADTYEIIIAKVTGLRRMTLAAIQTAATPEEVEVAVQAALASATVLATDMGLEAPPTSQISGEAQ
jgi:hypothetical protein